MYLIDDNEICIDLWKIIAHYGYSNQKKKAIEELGELTQALSKDLQYETNRDHISEEMADVMIMLNQLMLIYGNRGEIVRHIMEKLERTIDVVDRERETC